MALFLEKVSRWELAAGFGIQSDFADGPATGWPGLFTTRGVSEGPAIKTLAYASGYEKQSVLPMINAGYRLAVLKVSSIGRNRRARAQPLQKIKTCLINSPYLWKPWTFSIRRICGLNWSCKECSLADGIVFVLNAVASQIRFYEFEHHC
jgi:hypothetical protein